MRSDGAQQASIGARVFFTTQAGGCAYNACGVVRPAQGSEVASPSAALSSQRNMSASGSLRSARRRHETHAMNLFVAPAKRSERLYIRLTADESDYIAQLADSRGVKVSDYVRKAALRGTGRRPKFGRRVLPTDAAGTIRELSAIARDLRRLVVLAEANALISNDQLQACVAALHAAVVGLAA
jgi:hypothetical protein